MSMDFDRIKFRDFIRRKFAEWRGDSLSSLTDFADYIGVSQAVVSKWYNGKLKQGPDPATYKKLVARFGDEVYHAVGLGPPEDPRDQLPPGLRSDLDAAITEASSIILSRGIEPGTDEAFEVAKEVFSKYRIHLSKMTKSG